MLLGILASHGVLPLEFKPAYLVGDLLLWRRDEAQEQEAEKRVVCDMCSAITSRECIRPQWRQCRESRRRAQTAQS
jgi:hypothetical protein